MRIDALIMLVIALVNSDYVGAVRGANRRLTIRLGTTSSAFSILKYCVPDGITLLPVGLPAVAVATILKRARTCALAVRFVATIPPWEWP